MSRWHQALMMLAIAAAAAVALIAWRRGSPGTVAMAVALASMAGVSLWIGVIRPGLASRRSFKIFAMDMRTVTDGQPVYTPGGPDYEVSYYYGAPIRQLALPRQGGGDSTPQYVLVWARGLGDKRLTGLGREVMASRPALDGSRLVLLKIDANRFDQSPADR
jgi:hypothetical protein